MFAPAIDRIIESLKRIPVLMDFEMYAKLSGIYQEMSYIKPGEYDEIRILWLEVPRGTIKNFGRFSDYKKEKMVETYEEFESLWRDYYPDETKWYSIATAKYKEELFFYFDSKLIFKINETAFPDTNNKYNLKKIYRFLDWLKSWIKKEIKKLKQDVDGYNNYLEKNLSYNKHFGRIKRKDFWNILGNDAIRIDERLGNERLDKLKKIADALKNQNYPVKIPRMTADDYFRYCEICYDANDYFKKSQKKLSPLKKYRDIADGRDGGLCSIEGNSEEAFNEWYHHGKVPGSHPWEICRGGNSTHISLAEEIFRMVTGSDYIGIVPDYHFPRYCHSLFPAEDRIIDFMNLGYEDTEDIIKYAYWYPVEKIEIV